MTGRLAILVALCAPGVAAAADDAFPKVVAPFLKEHCVACHGEERQEAGVRLDRLAGVTADDRHLWTQVHEQVAAGRMPPKGKPRPADAEAKQLLAWAAERQRALGVASARRLNRRGMSPYA